MTIYLIIIFVVCTFVGYLLIKNVPSLLHTPLMSGMNALSGLTLLAAFGVTAIAVSTGNKILGLLGIIFGTINIVAGFGLTHRMLSMFNSSDKHQNKGDKK